MSKPAQATAAQQQLSHTSILTAMAMHLLQKLSSGIITQASMAPVLLHQAMTDRIMQHSISRQRQSPLFQRAAATGLEALGILRSTVHTRTGAMVQQSWGSMQGRCPCWPRLALAGSAMLRRRMAATSCRISALQKAPRSGAFTDSACCMLQVYHAPQQHAVLTVKLLSSGCLCMQLGTTL